MSETRQAPPNDYRDPFWQDLIAGTEQRLGLPNGLLASVVTNGERTPNDRVSSAGARTVFQIIPETRNAAIQKYGVDPYLNPENAAEVAGRLLQDSLQRNRGDVSAAVAEYHGGTNRANWGPITRSYTNRVMAGMQTDQEPVASQQSRAALQGFIAQRQQEEQQRNPLTRVYQAYRAGELTPEEQKQFEDDVRSNRVMLPPGGALLGELPRGLTAPSRAFEAPQQLLEAYTSGRLSRNEKIEFERDVEKGIVKVPEGFQLEKTEELGLLGRVREAVTGEERRVAATEALPDWATMPELNQASFASFRAGLGTMASSPEETVRIIQAQFPGVQVRQDDRGNYILRSSVNGQEYAIKPGARISDIPRAVGTALAFTPAGRAPGVVGGALATGATQAGIEGTQALAGGSFDAGDVGMAAALGGAIPAAINVTQMARPLAQRTLDRLRGGAAAAPEVPPGGAAPPAPGMAAQAAPEPPPTAAPRVAPQAAPEPPAAAPRAAAAMPEAPPAGAPQYRPVAPDEVLQPGVNVRMNLQTGIPEVQVTPSPAAARPVAPAVSAMTGPELAQTARTAAQGGIFRAGAAREALAREAAPNPETVAAAQRLGIMDFLQPDHVTTSQAYRELAQAIKSVPSSQTRAAEMEGLQRVGERAQQILDSAGRTPRSELDATLRARFQNDIKLLSDASDRLYTRMREIVPARAEANADEALRIVNRRLEDLGGEKSSLTRLERSILQKLGPRENAPAPTYALLDDVRREVGRAARQQGPFADADTGLAKRLYAALTDDAAAVAERYGAKEMSDLARASVKMRKGIEDDFASLFGRELSGSMLNRMDQAIQAISKGDISKLSELLKAVPPDMRQEVVANGLATAFGRAAKNGELNFTTFTKWFDGLQKEPRAMTFLMSNLPKETVAQLKDLYQVSKGVSMATREAISTGRLREVSDQLKPADTLMGKVMEFAQRSAVGVPIEAATQTIGLPGVGLAASIVSTLRAGKTTPMQAADALIASPEFRAVAIDAVKTQGQPSAGAVRRMAVSQSFRKFAEQMNLPRDVSGREAWIRNAIQTERQYTNGNGNGARMQ